MPMSHPFILGHRGAFRRAPENTAESLAAALAEGADGVEYDVQLSSDGVPFLLHDDSLLRTCGMDATAREVDWPRLSALEAGAPGHRIPSLARILGQVGGIHDLELKAPRGGFAPPDRARLLSAVLPLFSDARRRGRISPRSALTSFDGAILELAARLDSEVPFGIIVETPDEWRNALALRLPRNPSVLAIAFPLATRVLEPSGDLPPPFASASLWFWGIPENAPDETAPWLPEALVVDDPAGTRARMSLPEDVPEG